MAGAAEHGAQAAPLRQRRQALIERSFVFEGVFGDTPKLLEALEIAEKAAPTDLPVLIDGESGTGKELMAKVIHANGSRGGQALHLRQLRRHPGEPAGVGAVRPQGRVHRRKCDRKDSSRRATPAPSSSTRSASCRCPVQVKLLRVLEAHEIQRVGSDEPIAVDARVVAATNRNLAQMMREGKFREDLFYRLSVIHVTVPPLRERKDEIPLLFEFFGDEAAEALSAARSRLSRRLRTFLLRLRLSGQYPRAAQHRLPPLVPGRRDGGSGAPARDDPPCSAAGEGGAGADDAPGGAHRAQGGQRRGRAAVPGPGPAGLGGKVAELARRSP